MGDSKITIYRVDTDCNKKKFDSIETVTQYFDIKNQLKDSVRKIYSKYKDINYDSFSYVIRNDSLITKIHYKINDSTKIKSIWEKTNYYYSKDTLTINNYSQNKF